MRQSMSEYRRKGPLFKTYIAMNQQNGFLELVRLQKGRHFGVDIKCLPESPGLVLEAKRGQGTIVAATSGNS